MGFIDRRFPETGGESAPLNCARDKRDMLISVRSTEPRLNEQRDTAWQAGKPGGAPPVRS